jgi:ATP-dependent exoDNAse (exonuclease V) beta subunit
MDFGSQLHAAFEGVEWVDETKPVLPDNDAGSLVRELLDIPAIRGVFEKKGRKVELYCEQAVEAIVSGEWLSGVIDRLHVFRDPLGLPERVELIDFKTDAVTKGEQLLERYSEQMNAYREVIGKAFGVPVTCRLLSTKLRTWVDC